MSGTLVVIYACGYVVCGSVAVWLWVSECVGGGWNIGTCIRDLRTGDIVARGAHSEDYPGLNGKLRVSSL